MNRNQSLYRCIFFLLTILLLNGCGGTMNYFKEIKSDFHASYHTKNSAKNIKKDKVLFEKYIQNFQVGKVVNINAKNLSRDEGKIGLWLPSKFIEENGGGIYLLEEYDKNKIPVVFIHGAGGNAKEWEYFVNNLDSSKYQAVLISYPSGIKLQLSSEILSQKLKLFAKQHNIDQYIFIAHSMGGLVAKKVIQLLNGNQDVARVTTFISISTPWNGHEGAKNVEKLPYYIPSWEDMKANSKFIKSIKDNDILDNVIYYLLFGYKGDDTIFSRDNDGVISLSSQLSNFAQFEAEKMYGFNEDHISILVSKDVVNMVNKILDNKLQ